MNDRERFYLERDRRTVQYGIDPVVLERRIAVVVGDDAAASRPGQAGALALVNMLARIHRAITIVIPPVPLLAQTLLPGGNLRDAAVRAATAINPFIDLRVSERASGDSLAVGLGRLVPRSLDLYVGAEGAKAIIAAEPVAISALDPTVLGAGLGVCLAAADLLHLAASGATSVARQVSLWGFAEGPNAGRRPDVLPRLDLGHVVVVGGGAVGSCLLYWVREIGAAGTWEVVDGDAVELHNTNRSLGLVAQDAGWPDGQPSNKADCAARLTGAAPHPYWYDEWLQRHPTARPDLVIPLANDHGVRHAIGQRGEAVLVSATTSPHETAALHRQIPGRDDCMDCRFPEENTPRFSCSTSSIESSKQESADAALPYLSASAGLLLAAGLLQLQGGQLAGLCANQWTLWVATRNRSWQPSVRQCRASCRSALPPEAVRQLNAKSRWRSLLP